MRYQIESIEDFANALDMAKDNDTIDGQGIVLEVKHRTFATDAMLKIENINFNKIWKNDSVTISARENLMMKHCSFGVSNHKDGNITFIKAEGGDDQRLHIYDSKFFNANYIGVQTFNCGHAEITDCEFDYNSPTSHGYGIWQGGSGSANNQQLIVKGCQFNRTRHAVAGHYNPNHIIVEDCDFFNNVKHVLDRHSGVPGNSNAFGHGGGNYDIINNKFHDTDRFALSAPIPLDNNQIIVDGNVFSRAVGKAFEIEMDINGVKTLVRDDEVNNPQVVIEWNKYTKE